MIEVRTQAELDKALKKTNGGKDELIVCLGGGHFVLRESSSAVLRESSSAVLRESSSAVLRESSSAVLWGSSSAEHGVTYEPGSEPEASDWDGGEAECGGGLHFSPHPKMAREFNCDAAHFIACPVAVSEIVVHPEGSMPEKVKARRVCAPCWECSIDGKPLQVEGPVK